MIDMIVQSETQGDTNDISFTLNKDECQKAQQALAGVVKELGAKEISTLDGIAKLSIVGIGMRSLQRRFVRGQTLRSEWPPGGSTSLLISVERNHRPPSVIDDAKIAEAANLAPRGV
jgi:aspartate kinase